MTTTEIELPRKLTNQLLHLAQLSPTKEICGLIGSINGTACNSYPIDNSSHQAETHFQLETQQRRTTLQNISDNHEALFAVYHSHFSPLTPPSISDIELTGNPEANYLIISLNTKGVLEIRAFAIINKTIQEKTLRLTS